MPTDHNTECVKTRTALVNAKKDLNNAEIPGLVRWAFDPWKNILLNPTLELASRIAPVAKIIPFADEVIATSLNVPFNVLRFAYSIIPFHNGETTLINSSKNDLIHHAELAAFPKTPGEIDVPPIGSLLLALVAFVTSSSVDVATAFFSPQKTGEMIMALFQFSAFLDATGVGEELHDSLTRPLLYGRLLDNMRILERIQKMIHAQRQTDAEDGTPISKVQDEIDEGARFMRFATAAYGMGMIKSALDEDPNPEILLSTKKAIAHHVGIDVNDIRYLDARPGGDMNVLRHFIAVHHESKSIVLAIRGTLSVSGAIIDMQAYDAEFNGGVAHAGIARMTNNIWENSKEKILDLFREDELKDYGFVITGHSLGAGTACLLNIKFHTEEVLGNRPIRCFAFASPPVYKMTTENTIIKQAVETAAKNCTGYIHENDCIPFSSVLSIRQLSIALDTVDETTEDMFLPTRVSMAMGLEDIPEVFVEDVEVAPNTITEEERVSRLIIPARHVLWLYRENGTSDYVGSCCDPHKVAHVEIGIRLGMISDHFPEGYENSLDKLATPNRSLS